MDQFLVDDPQVSFPTYCNWQYRYTSYIDSEWRKWCADYHIDMPFTDLLIPVTTIRTPSKIERDDFWCTEAGEFISALDSLKYWLADKDQEIIPELKIRLSDGVPPFVYNNWRIGKSTVARKIQRYVDDHPDVEKIEQYATRAVNALSALKEKWESVLGSVPKDFSVYFTTRAEAFTTLGHYFDVDNGSCFGAGRQFNEAPVYLGTCPNSFVAILLQNETVYGRALGLWGEDSIAMFNFYSRNLPGSNYAFRRMVSGALLELGYEHRLNSSYVSLHWSDDMFYLNGDRVAWTKNPDVKSVSKTFEFDMDLVDEISVQGCCSACDEVIRNQYEVYHVEWDGETYCEHCYNDLFVYSEYEDTSIPADEATFREYWGDYILTEDAVECEFSNEYFHSEEIVELVRDGQPYLVANVYQAKAEEMIAEEEEALEKID